MFLSVQLCLYRDLEQVVCYVLISSSVCLYVKQDRWEGVPPSLNALLVLCASVFTSTAESKLPSLMALLGIPNFCQ
jgi:hypothetical protein